MDIADDVEGARMTRGEGREDRSSSPDPGSRADHDGRDAEPAPRAEVLESLWNHLAEFRAYAEELVRIEKDRAKLSIREALSRFRREALVFFALCTLVVTGSIYLLTGLSGGLSAVFGGRPWIGNLLIGLGALIVAAVWMRVHEARKSKSELDRKIAEYEQRQEEQRARFGRHVADRHAQPGTASAADGAGAARSSSAPGAAGDGGVSPRRPG